MKKTALALSVLLSLFVGGDSSAEQWVPIPKYTPVAYFDTDSIQFPKLTVYDLGLFTMSKVDRDIMRVWTRFDVNQREATRILYEIKFSSRLYKALYAVDKYGNRTPPSDQGYKPILPGSLECDLYDTIKPLAGLDENKYPFPDRFLDASD